MRVNDAILGDVPQPEMERHLGVLEIVGQSPVGFNENILDHVTDVDTPHQFLIHSQLYHSAKGIAMPLHQLIDGIRVAFGGMVQEFLCLFRFGPHGFIMTTDPQIKKAISWGTSPHSAKNKDIATGQVVNAGDRGGGQMGGSGLRKSMAGKPELQEMGVLGYKPGMTSRNHPSDFPDDEEDFDAGAFAEEFEDSESYDDFFEPETPLDEPDSEGDEPESGCFFEVSPESIVEAMLFVGNPENRPLQAGEMASLMRGVEEGDVEELVNSLNESYRASSSPFEVVCDDQGYRLVLASDYEFCRQRFYREEKAATLSQSIVDVLALVAYLQPVTKKLIEKKRMKPSGSILNQLVRRRLIAIERRTAEGSKRAQTFYRTTERFLELFGLEQLEELPQSQAFDGE